MKLWEEIEAAQKKIQKVIPRTPMIYSDTFSKLTGKEVFLKLENLQKTGSFKIRGAYYKLSQFTPSMKKGGVVTASAGNHAQGVAWASSLLGIHSTIVLEILKEVPDVEAIVIPVGGGGLISGIATIVKKRRPRVKIIGVQSIHAPSAFYSLKRKKIVEVKVRTP